MLKELVEKTRSYRRFYEEKKLSREDLVDCINLARLTASGSNKQPLRYLVFTDEKMNAEIYPNLKWAGYLTEWDGPEKGERPTGYIFLVEPEGVNATHDEGIAAQTIMLAAMEKGIGGCMLGSIDRVSLAKVIGLPEGYTIKLCLAFGYPKEEVVLEEVSAKDDIKYYRDENQVHHVPKIKLDEIILN